jgi:hypothetical protein
MAAIGCEEHGDAVAERLNGETTSQPLAGLYTVTFAKAGTAHTSSAKKKQAETLMSYFPVHFSEQAHSTYKISLAGAGRAGPNEQGYP